MDDSIYQEKVSPILTELTNIAAKLVQVYKNKLEKNLNIINAYIMSPDFNLIARDGSQIKVQNTFYIELSPQSGVFLDSTEGKIIVFEYMSDIDYNMPQELNDDFLYDAFQDSNFFKDVMHIIGLDGIQEANLAYQQQKLSSLKSLIEQ